MDDNVPSFGGSPGLFFCGGAGGHFLLYMQISVYLRLGLFAKTSSIPSEVSGPKQLMKFAEGRSKQVIRFSSVRLN